MSEYNRIIECLEEMKPRYDAGFSLTDRQFLEDLNYRLYRKRITLTGCSNCYRDAYIIIYNYLKRLGCMPKAPEYVLRSGELLHEFGGEYYAGEVESETAERFLARDPSIISLFDVYPSDWNARITQKNASESKDCPDVANDTADVETTPQRPKRGRPSRKS